MTLHRRGMMLAAAAAATAGLAAAQTPEPVGKVDRVQGQAQVERGGQTVTLAAGGAVFEDDVITTGPESRVSLVFVDESTLTIGADGEMVIDSFVYNKAGQRNSAIYNCAAGAFLTKTGGIGKANPEAVLVVTPVVTIGIRGTQFWGGRLERDFEVLVLEGRVVVTNAAGSVELGPNQTTSVVAANAAPAPASVMPDDRRTRRSRQCSSPTDDTRGSWG